MPFADEYRPIFDECIKPVAQELQLIIKRGDDFFARHAIMADVWTALVQTEMVVAEYSGRNANVFYELGIAHTLGRPAVLIARSLESIPFDLRHLRTLVYEPTPDGFAMLRDNLKDALSRIS
jgi:hypothetical protein